MEAIKAKRRFVQAIYIGDFVQATYASLAQQLI
jgi:hypothetical protein